ncbi:MAG: hypothetical protein ACI8P3_000126 [Saprospiraceae bacterium]|jgi:hypothetical protein
MYSKKQYLSLFLLLFFTATGLFAQSDKNIWSTLALMKFERHKGNGSGKGSQIIPLIEALDGTDVTVKGYVIPLSGKKAQSHFMFSAYPYSSCYFCGGAGPETIMEAFIKGDEKINFSDTAITLKGTFKFSSRDPNDIMFTLENAVLIE